MQFDNSKRLFAEAQQYIPGGVDSPVRAFRSVGGQPLFIARGQGSRLYDVDGNEFVDYVMSWGPLIAGHAHPEVVAAIQEAACRGTSYGAPTEAETELAKLVVAAVPSVEMVRFVNSGTEATMTALRLARAFTRREKIVKFEGHYHGHADMLLVKAGSGQLTLGAPDSPGVPAGAAANTISAPFNNLAAVAEVFARYPDEIAAIIVEPVGGNMGVLPPAPGFLHGLRDLTQKHGVLLIFDEVITGFRLSYGGAQALFGVTPDLTCLGKIIGGGLPVGAYGGPARIMEQMAPTGPVYQAGTLSGNPLAMAAGIATLKLLQRPGVYQELDRKAARLSEGIARAAKAQGVPVYQTRVGSMMCTFFNEQPVTDYVSAKGVDTCTYGRFFHAMLQNGVYLAPSQFETAFMSLAHSDEDVEQTIKAAEAALDAVS